MIPAVLDRDLKITQRQWLQFQVHLNRCSECKNEYLRYKNLYNTLNGLQSIPEPDYQNLRVEISKKINTPVKKARNVFKELFYGSPYTIKYSLVLTSLIILVGITFGGGIAYRNEIINFYHKIFSHPPISTTNKDSIEDTVVIPELPTVPFEEKKVADEGEKEEKTSEIPQMVARSTLNKETIKNRPELSLEKKDLINLRVLQTKKTGEQLKIYFNILKNGRLVENLVRDNLSFMELYPEKGWIENNSFELFTPGEKEPFYVALLLDYSDSMTPNLSLVESGAKQFINNLTRNDRIMIIKFAEDVVVATDGFTNDRKLLYSAVEKRFMLRFSTSLYKAIDVGLNELRDKGENKLLIVLTDGDDTHSNAFVPPVGFEDVLLKARALRVPIITVGLGKEIGSEKLSELATGTGGLFIKVEKPEELVFVYNELGRTIIKTPCIVVDYPVEKYSQIERFKIIYREKELSAEATLIKKNK